MLKWHLDHRNAMPAHGELTHLFQFCFASWYAPEIPLTPELENPGLGVGRTSGRLHCNIWGFREPTEQGNVKGETSETWLMIKCYVFVGEKYFSTQYKKSLAKNVNDYNIAAYLYFVCLHSKPHITADMSQHRDNLSIFFWKYTNDTFRVYKR